MTEQVEAQDPRTRVGPVAQNLPDGLSGRFMDIDDYNAFVETRLFPTTDSQRW